MKDLTKGNVLKTIAAFSLPLIAGNLFQLLYNFTDSLIVGNILGVNELAGVGATGSLNFLTAFWLAPAFGYAGIVFCEPIAWVLCMLLLLINFYRDSRVKALAAR